MKQSKFWLVITIITILSLAYAGYAQGAVDTTKITKEVVYNDAKHLIEVGDARVSGALSSLGKSLKVGADQVWIVLVKQQKVWSIGFLLLTLSALANWYVFYAHNFRKLKASEYHVGEEDVFEETNNPLFDLSYYNKYKEYEGRSNWASELGDIRYKKTIILAKGKKTCLIPIPINPNTIYYFKYLHLIICLALSIFSFIHFSDMLTGFINPEFGAMKTIAEIAQNLN